jgi:hypothetical protein
MGRGQQAEAATSAPQRKAPRRRSNKRLVEGLRSLRVFNSYDFYDGETPQGQVFIYYHTGDAWHPSGWDVSRRGYQLGTDRLNTSKQFIAFEGSGAKERKELAFAAAQTWASERYGITEWAKDPFGGFGDATFVAERLAALEADLENAESLSS